jgi:hypothetical protein
VRHFGRIETDPVTGKSGREQILQRMRSADVLLLLHGVEPICAEYIPSKMYEYLWMQRPILAVVHKNQQMARLLALEGHPVLQVEGTGSNGWFDPELLVNNLKPLCLAWSQNALPDRKQDNPHTTAASVSSLLEWTLTGAPGSPGSAVSTTRNPPPVKMKAEP